MTNNIKPGEFGMYVNRGGRRAGYLAVNGQLTAWAPEAMRFESIEAVNQAIAAAGWTKATGVTVGVVTAYACWAPPAASPADILPPSPKAVQS